jgi:hypothetical protein
MRTGLAILVFLTAAGLAYPQDQDADSMADPEEEAVRFKVSGELKAHFRWSAEDFFPVGFPFPPTFIPIGRDRVFLETVAPGSSFEVSVATLFLDVELPQSISGHVKINFINLYDRNPTSTDHTVSVREAWVQFGERYESLEALPGTTFYGLFGKAPKFEKQSFRRLESYGLVSTAFNRFEDLQLQVGGSVGEHFYFRGQISNGNPTFFRDPNALAGDNGTVMPPNPDPELGSGFPIFYHAEVEDLQIDDDPEYGVGAGFRFLTLDQERGIDLLGFYYNTNLSEGVKLNGTFYEGDLDLLDGAGGISLPIEGNDRMEYGFNADAQLGDLGLFFQWVHEEAASLPRDGVEIEIGYGFEIGDPGDPNQLFPVVQPAFRYSRLDNDFSAPPAFVAPSAVWDWQKFDLGVRITIIQRLDLTVEYTFYDIESTPKVDPDEFLTTLRLRF